ncbi:glycosyltransferase [bacterium]|nr:glycosyltransferase [bacterium]
MKIAWFSPIGQSSNSKGALYSQSVLPELAQRHEITVVVDDKSYCDIGEAATYLGLKVLILHQALNLDLKAKFDAFVYQIESNPGSAWTPFFQAEVMPGVLVVHDFPIDTVPLSAAAMVFNAPAAHGIRARGFTGYIGQTAMPWIVAESKGFPDTECFRLGLCGLPERNNRFYVLRNALENILQSEWGANQEFEITWIARSEAEEREIEALISACATKIVIKSVLIKDRLQRYSEIQNFSLYSALCLDTRHSLDPEVYAAVAAGVPVLCADFGPSADLPRELVFKIRLGLSEVREVENVIQALQDVRIDRKDLQQAGKRYLELFHDTKSVVADLERVLEKTAQLQTQLADQRRSQQQAARAELIKTVFGESFDRSLWYAETVRDFSWI